MKKKSIIFFVLLIACTTFAQQQPKREVRSVWLTTAWALDWPSVRVPAPMGDNEAERETARNQQKSELIEILNRLENANFNTVYFQVRGMSDAFYSSKFEPWSQYLSLERGANPGWSPLEFIIEEAHKRGIEVHAWINPLRYSTSATNHGNLPTDYANTHPHWLLDYAEANRSQPYMKILNPGIPEVRERIADIVEDIIRNYNVDGIVFDDYFYLSGTTNAMDDAQFQAYNPDGLTRTEWRRENINQLIAEVHTRIDEIAPWVAFGVSPAGIPPSDPNTLNRYGVEPFNLGATWPPLEPDFSSPLTWLSQNIIDYISPQIYFPIETAGNIKYEAVTTWWSKVANQFGRHIFVSNASHRGGNTASGERFSNDEIIRQIQFTRNQNLNGTSGAVLFRTNSFSQEAYNALKNELFQFPALTAIYGWKDAPPQGLVENLNVSGQNVTWNYADDNVRFAIYAIPNANRNDEDIFTSPNYLQGVRYTTNFTLPEGINAATHKIAVAVYDRFGNLFPARVFDETKASVPEIDTPEFFRIYRVSDGISNLVINQAENSSVIVEIYSVTGNLLDRQTHRLNAGTNTITLDMTNYAKGIYLAKISNGNNTETLRVHR